MKDAMAFVNLSSYRPKRTCAACGENLGGIGGFCLARDVLKALQVPSLIFHLREFCTKCVHAFGELPEENTDE